MFVFRASLPVRSWLSIIRRDYWFPLPVTAAATSFTPFPADLFSFDTIIVMKERLL
jgi:hypothetical protein